MTAWGLHDIVKDAKSSVAILESCFFVKAICPNRSLSFTAAACIRIVLQLLEVPESADGNSYSLLIGMIIGNQYSSRLDVSQGA